MEDFVWGLEFKAFGLRLEGLGKDQDQGYRDILAPREPNTP